MKPSPASVGKCGGNKHVAVAEAARVITGHLPCKSAIGGLHGMAWHGGGADGGVSRISNPAGSVIFSSSPNFIYPVREKEKPPRGEEILGRYGGIGLADANLTYQTLDYCQGCWKIHL